MTTTGTTVGSMESLKRNIKAHLRAEDEVLLEFTEKFVLTPLTSSTAGYTVKGRLFFTTKATFQIDGNDKVGVVGSVTNQDGIKTLEVYLEDRTIEVNTRKKDLARSTRALLLSDKRIKRALGRSISLTQLTRGDSLSNVNGKSVKETFASFQVEGKYETGVASVSATEDDVTELVVYVGDDKICVNVPYRSLGATTA